MHGIILYVSVTCIITVPSPRLVCGLNVSTLCSNGFYFSVFVEQVISSRVLAHCA